MEKRVSLAEFRLACATGDFETIIAYVERGGNLNYVFIGGHTAPMIAAMCKQAEVLKYLFDHRANFLYKNPKGFGVLDYAKGNDECLKIAQKAVATQQLIVDLGLEDEYFEKTKVGRQKPSDRRKK